VTLRERIGAWVVSRLGGELLRNRPERAMRLAEEAIELAQAEGVSESDVARIVARVYSRPKGEPTQEMGGVMVCCHAWAIAAFQDLDKLTEREVNRVEAVPAEVTRAKHAAKAHAGTALMHEYGKRGD
jgi:hypothetical protein